MPETQRRLVMKLMKYIIAALFLFTVPVSAYAIGAELAIGAWGQSPSGTLGYNAADTLDLEGDFKYDRETRVFGRLKIDMPLIIPNVYLVATPMAFEGKGNKSQNFTFGDETFNGNADFNSKVTLDHYDIALYYGIPFLKTATLGKLNVELGINARILDFSAEVTGQVTSGPTATDSTSVTIPVPMIYVGAQINPIKLVSLEFEGRGIAYNNNSYYDFIGRVKVKPLGIPLLKPFIAVGWRQESIKIDVDDIKADLKFSGPFAEVGVEF